MGPHYLEQFINGRASYPIGNSHQTFSPHGAYKCAGENSWCVISIENEDQWASLKHLINNEPRLEDSKFATMASRLIHRTELDLYINQWSSGLDAYKVMIMLQERNIPCGVVQNGKEIFDDKHLRDRNFYTKVDYAGTGPIDYPDQFMGAEVIKLEPPGGDAARQFEFITSEGISGYFMQQNCGKKDISLDLANPQAQKAVRELAAISDVVVENFRPGVMERLGLGYSDLLKINPLQKNF